MLAEDLAGVEVDDGDGGVVDEREDSFAAVLLADAEVVHVCCAAQDHFAVGADGVVSKAEVSFARCRGEGFG